MRYQTIYVDVSGCDDNTCLRIDGVPENVAEAFEHLAAAVTDHGGGCSPTMRVADEPLWPTDSKWWDVRRVHWDGLTGGDA